MLQTEANPAEAQTDAHERLYSLDALQNRVARVRSAMSDKGIDSMLVSHPFNRNYLIGFSGEDQPPLDTAGILIVGPDSLCLVTDARYTISAAAELYSELGIEVVARQGAIVPFLAEQINKRNYKRLG